MFTQADIFSWIYHSLANLQQLLINTLSGYCVTANRRWMGCLVSC